MTNERPTPSHERFEHTADVGLRVRAGSLADLFAEAARGLSALLVENPEAIEERTCVTFDLAASRPEDLLVDWLSELLYALETSHLVFRRYEVAVAEGGLRARVWGERLDPGRHRPASEVKAVTYHGLTVQETATGWLAEIVLDI